MAQGSPDTGCNAVHSGCGKRRVIKNKDLSLICTIPHGMRHVNHLSLNMTDINQKNNNSIKFTMLRKIFPPKNNSIAPTFTAIRKFFVKKMTENNPFR